jgi:hypothetical protein
METPPYQTLLTLLEHVDAFAVIEHLQALGTPVEVAAAYDALVRDAYWQQKDLAMVGLLATAGIYYCFAHAKLAADEDMRAGFKSTAKTLAYNLASFTWPGWDEPGVTIDPADMARGLDAARLNVRLSMELGKSFDKVRSAAWLLGAHLLAAGRLEEAAFQFRYAVPGPNEKDHALFKGYALLADLLMEGPAGPASMVWAEYLAALDAVPDEQAKFAREQLATAHRVFSRRR